MNAWGSQRFIIKNHENLNKSAAHQNFIGIGVFQSFFVILL
jgi:hypothetical protein